MGGLVRVELVAVEANDAIASRFLCDVERVVGGSHQGVALFHLWVRPSRHAKAGRAREGSARKRECIVLDAFAHPLGEVHGVLDLGAGEEQHELLAAIPSNAIDLARLLPQNVGKLLEHFVAGLMPVRVVHALELVEIAHHEREGLLQALRMREHLVDAFVEVAAVVQAGERVGLRHVAQSVVHLEQLLLALFERVLEPLDAQHRVEPSLQLRKVDRLGDVVVGARFEPLHFILGGVERRLHDDRNERQTLVRLDLPRDLDPTDFGHHDVEQDQVGRCRLDELEGIRAVVRRARFVAPAFQPRLEHLDVVLIVVDDQDARGLLRRWCRSHASGGRSLSRHSARCPCRGSAVPPRPRHVARTVSRDIRRNRLPSPSRDPRPGRAP